MIPWDDLLREVDRAGERLASGKERQHIRDRLNEAIEKNPKSGWRGLAKQLSQDLTDSVYRSWELPGTEDDVVKRPELYLFRTRIGPFMFPRWDGGGGPDKGFVKGNPRDPASLILNKDRSFIERLIPLLGDMSPTRSYRSCRYFSGCIPQIPRVCDVAISIIEHFSQCRFHCNASNARMFHELSAKQRKAMVEHVQKWWRENRDSSVAAGIRWQLPHAGFYAKVWMAKNLFRLGDKADVEDEEYARQVLRELVCDYGPDHAKHAANALAELDGLSLLDAYYSSAKASLDRVGRIGRSHFAGYLARHGERREWELLNEHAKRELDRGLRVGTARAWPVLAGSERASSSPLAIPGLGLVLTRMPVSERRHVTAAALESLAGRQAFSYAGRATACLQKLTGIDFGYHDEDSAEKRLEAIRKARQWWAEEGSKKYTFDHIEKQLPEAETRTEAVPAATEE